MKQITINPNNEPYYSEDFIKGFKCGAQRQFETDKDNADRLQGEWIPCSERLPSDSGNYLITVADLRLGHIGEHTVTIADFYAKAKKWNSIVDVVAWMPLPTPYKGGEKE